MDAGDRVKKKQGSNFDFIHHKVNLTSSGDNTFIKMDRLTEYGSDSSSASASASGHNIDVGRKNQVSASRNGLASLVGGGSDAPEDENDVVRATAPNFPTGPPPSKEAKVETQSDGGNDSTAARSPGLPEPTLANDESDNCILWKTNYLQRPVDTEHQSSLEDSPSLQEMKRNLERLGHSLTTVEDNLPSNSWADHLKAQHEFHNPHLFASVVDHFGIQEPLGSCIRHDVGSNTAVKDYERRLFPLVSRSTEDDSAMEGTTSTT